MNQPQPIHTNPESPGSVRPPNSTVRTSARQAWLGLALGLVLAASADATDYTYVKVGDPAQTGGYPYGMDNRGRVVTTSLVRSFLFADNFHASYVEITNVNVATSTPGMLAQGINDLGEVVGRYRTNGLPANQTRGFIRRADGTFEPFDYPGVASTAIADINNLGHMVGETRSDLTAFGLTRGFVHTNDVSAEIHFPGAVLSRAFGINDAGDIVGQYQLEDSVSRPFLLRNGTYSEIVPTGSPDGLVSAIAYNISDNGMVLGTYRNTNNVTKTWVMTSDGTFSYPVLPGSGRTINNAGQISGTFADAANSDVATAFVATPKVEVHFVVHRIALTNSASSSASKINDRGEITGTVDGSDGVSRGYRFDTTTGLEIERAGYPGSGFTEWGGINASGSLAGYYADPADPNFGTYRAFVRDASGAYTPISWSGDPNFSFTVDIDEHGRVAGGGNNTAWVWHTNGTFQVFAVPGFQVNGAFGMNDQGLVVGAAWPGFFDTPNGLVYNISNNTATIWNYPGAAQTTLYGINNRGDIVGEFKPNLTSGNIPFVRWADGSSQVLNLPGLTGARVYDINDDRVIVGRYKDSANKNRSFYATPLIPRPEPLSFTFETVTAPFLGATETLLSDIDNNGRIIGRFKNALGVSQGLILDGTNQITFNITGTTATFPGGANSFGQIAGFYHNATNPAVQHGFLQSPNGSVTTIDGTVPGTTYVWRVNDRGEVNGYWFENDPFFIRSFRRDTNGTLSVFVYPGSPVGTVTRGMNEAGDLAGWKWNEAFSLEGVVFLRNGTTNVFTVPGWANTLPGDINNLGEVAGTVINAEFTRHAGFFRDADGRITVFSPPQAVEVEVFGLNDKSEIVGEYVDTGGKRQGFIARPAKRLDLGHTDAGLAFEDGRLQFHIHDEEADTEYAVHDAVLALGKASEQSIPDEVAYGFLGRPGYSTWILPATNNPQLLYLGLAAEEIPTGLFANDQLRIELVSVMGAGEFALYSAHAFGSPVIHLNTADGYDERDALVLQAGSHQHFNWAFSAPGAYVVRLRASGTLADGNRQVSTEASYTFTVPEPELPQPPEPDNSVYLLNRLGTLGGDYGLAVAINEAGTITGNTDLQSEDPYYSRPFRLSFPGSMENLGTLGGDHANGLGINAGGEVVGAANDGNGLNRPFHFSNGAMKDLGTLGGDNGEALGIGDGGVIVGWTETVPGESSPAHAFRRVPGGSLEDLGTLGGADSRAFALNSAGTVVGWSRNAANETRAFRWTPSGGMADLGTLGGNRAFATDINDSGDIVGRSRLAGNAITHATLWRGTNAPVDLGTLGGNQSGANAINQVGDVVGWSSLPGDDNTRFAALWPSGGTAVNLNRLLPEGEAWQFVEARDVNTNRWIVGYANHPSIGIDEPVLLTPATRVSLGDTDIGVALEDGHFHLHVHHEATDTEYEPHHALLHVAPVASRKVPDAPAFAFLGQPGAPVWILPESENPKLLFLGLAAEEIGQGVLTADQVQLALRSVDGPGQLALYTVDGFGTPQVRWNSADGLSDLDTFTLQTGGHQHVNWAFTAPGTYRVGLQASGKLVAGNVAITSEVVVYHFEVVSPEVELTLVRRDASNLTLSTTTKDGVVYQLQSASHTSGPWSAVGQPYVGTGRDKQFSVPITGAAGYFRVIPGAGN